MIEKLTPDSAIPSSAESAKDVPGKKGMCLALRGLVLLILVFLIYWPVLRGGFVWDDMVLVEKNELTTGEQNLHTIWFKTGFPLATVGFWLQGLLWGENPSGYHVVNVLLHALNCILLWRMLMRLKIPGAWLAGLIFAAHPVCVASVAWISEFKNTLSLAFFLLSLTWYLKFEKQNPSNSRAKSWLWYSLSWLAFLLSLLTKTSTVMLPIILLGCAWWQRGRVGKQDLLRTLPFFALALALGLSTVWFQSSQVIRETTVQTENFWGRLAGAGWATWFYLGKILLPVNLCMIYPRWKINATLMSLLPLLLLVAVLVLAGGLRKSWGRPVLFSFGCFVVALFPVLGFFDMYFMVFSRVSDHFAYLPLIPIIALVAAILRFAFSGKILRGIGFALICLLSVLTMQRAKVFASDEALWRDTVAKNPSAWNAHNNLACNLAERGQLDTAMEHFEISLRLNPDNASAHRNLGKALVARGDFAKAEAHFQKALKLKPTDTEALTTYAFALATQDRGEESVRLLRDALQLKPETETRLRLAQLLAGTGKRAEAAAEYREVLESKPDNVEALNNLAWILATCSDDSVRNGNEAVQFAELACKLTQYKQAMNVGTLAAAYAEAGRFQEAMATAQKAIQLATEAGNPQFAAINQQLLQLYSAARPYHEPPKPQR